MIMKNFNLFVAAIAFLFAIGCEKVDTKPESLTSAGDRCSLRVQFAGAGTGTRVAGQAPENESRIQNVQVFVFRTDQDDVLDASVSEGFDSGLDFDASSAAYSGLTLDCTAGQREIWAVVNAGSDHTSDGSVKNKADLLAMTSLLSENSASKLFMTGSKPASLASGTSSVTVEVKRACASVVLKGISNMMVSPAHQSSGSFRLKDVYLMNVPAKINYGMDTDYKDSEDWYARMSKETDGAKSALILDESEPKVLDYGETDNTQHTFYSYPNSCAPSHEPSWSPRATVLVVEAEFSVDGIWHECYYPITLHNGTGLERNKQYSVKLTINRPGSDSPNDPVAFGTLSGMVEVADWETGDSYTETI